MNIKTTLWAAYLGAMFLSFYGFFVEVHAFFCFGCSAIALLLMIAILKMDR